MDKNGIVQQESNSTLVFDKCCCCIPLKRGCLILAYLQLLGYIRGMTYVVQAITACVELLNAEYADESQKQIARALVIFAVFDVLMMLIAFSFSILLLIGLHQDKRKYIKKYLICTVIMMVLTLIEETIKFFTGYSESVVIITVVVAIVINFYYLLVIRSHYVKLGWSSNDSTGDNPIADNSTAENPTANYPPVNYPMAPTELYRSTTDPQ